MINTDHMAQTIEEAVSRWKKDDVVNTIEMGGLGPGYEQCIQIGVFSVAEKLIGNKFPEGNEALNKYLHEVLHQCIKEQKGLSGLSGAQAGAIMNLAYHYVKDGYLECIKKIAQDDPDRIILVNRSFPQGN